MSPSAPGLVTRCPRCGQPNRVPAARLFDRPKCGVCRAPLPVGGAPIDLSDGDFDAFMRGATVPVVVDFWASWCQPCKSIAPVLEVAAKELAGKLVVVKVDTDQNPGLAERFDASSIPLLVAFRGGEPFARQVGAPPTAELTAWLEAAVNGLAHPRARNAATNASNASNASTPAGSSACSRAASSDA